MFASVVWKECFDKRRHRRFEDAREAEGSNTRVRLLRGLNDDRSLPTDIKPTVQVGL